MRGGLLPPSRPRAGRAAGLDLLFGIQHVPSGGDSARRAGARHTRQRLERDCAGGGAQGTAAGRTGVGVGEAIIRRLSRRGIKHGFFAQRQGSPSAGATRAFHGRSRLSGGTALRRRDGKKPSRRQSVAALRGGGGSKAQGKGGETVESVPAALRTRRRAL